MKDDQQNRFDDFMNSTFDDKKVRDIIQELLGGKGKLSEEVVQVFRITGKIFCIAKGMPPPVNLNNKKYKKSFLLNKSINFSILVASFFLIKSLKKKFAR